VTVSFFLDSHLWFNACLLLFFSSSAATAGRSSRQCARRAGENGHVHHADKTGAHLPQLNLNSDLFFGDLRGPARFHLSAEPKFFHGRADLGNTDTGPRAPAPARLTPISSTPAIFPTTFSMRLEIEAQCMPLAPV
jgi:hypothetical protein